MYYQYLCVVSVCYSTVEPGVSTVGIHYTDTKEDVDLELDNVYPLGKCVLKFCTTTVTYCFS